MDVSAEIGSPETVSVEIPCPCRLVSAAVAWSGRGIPVFSGPGVTSWGSPRRGSNGVVGSTIEDCGGVPGENGVTARSSIERLSTSSATGGAGDPGRGVEAGDSGCCFAVLIGDGEPRAEAPGVVALEASPIAKVVAARNLSSRVDFDNLLSRGGLMVELLDTGAGLPERWVTRDLRRLDSADSANWPEDNGDVGRKPCESGELGGEPVSRWSSSDELSRRTGGGAKLSTAWRN